MRKQKKLIITIFLLLSFLIVPTTSLAMSGIEITEGTITGEIFYPAIYYGETIEGFGPGSEVSFRTPHESGYVWIDPIEPTKATWKIYQPGLRPFLTIEKELTFKKKMTTGEHIGMWAFADTATFIVPAFAETGTWLAKPEITMADGSIRQGVSAENPDIKYIAFPVVGGDPITNLFGSPWYLAGWKMPPVFWFPLVLIWGPALFIGICYASPKVSEVFINGIGRLKGARSKWKK